MKKITFLVALLTMSLGYSQTDIMESFDGAAPTVNLYDDCGAGTFSISTEQAQTGTKSLKIITGAAGSAWQGAELILQGDALDLTTATNNKLVKAHVYSTVATDILAKVSEGGGAASATDASHNGNGWQELTFDFSNGKDNTVAADGVYTNLIFYPLWNNVNGTCTNGCYSPYGTPCVSEELTIYVDNILGTAATTPETCTDGIMNNGETAIDCGGPNCNACPNPPMGPPTTPPSRATADVKSVYSNAYATAPTDGFQTFGGAVVTEIDYSGNTIQSVTTPVSGAGLQYQYFGVSPQFLDLSDMSNMHIDFYFEGTPTTAGTVFLVIAQYSDGTNIQKTFDVTGLASSTWHEMDIAFDDFDLNSTHARDAIQQVIVQTAGPDNYGPFYFDNLYFHKDTLGTQDFTADAQFKVFPNPTANNWNVVSKSTISSITIYNILGKQVQTISPNATSVEINSTNLTSGIYLATIKGENGTKTVKLIKE